MLCNRAIEDSGGLLNHGNLWMHSQFNALWEQAERALALHYPKASLEVHGTFRGPRREARDVDTKATWNGQSTPDAARTCPAYNDPEGKCQHVLSPDGTCMRKHVCDKWVTNKGPGGRCLGNHPRYKCTNPNKCDKPVGAASQ